MEDLVVQRKEGLYCPPGDFYIDPWRAVQALLALDDQILHRSSGQYRLRVAKSANRIAPYAIHARLRLTNGRRR